MANRKVTPQEQIYRSKNAALQKTIQEMQAIIEQQGAALALLDCETEHLRSMLKRADCETEHLRSMLKRAIEAVQQAVYGVGRFDLL